MNIPGTIRLLWHTTCYQVPCLPLKLAQLVLSILEMAPYPTGGLNNVDIQIASLKQPSPYALHFPESWG